MSSAGAALRDRTATGASKAPDHSPRASSRRGQAPTPAHPPAPPPSALGTWHRPARPVSIHPAESPSRLIQQQHHSALRLRITTRSEAPLSSRTEYHYIRSEVRGQAAVVFITPVPICRGPALTHKGAWPRAHEDARSVPTHRSGGGSAEGHALNLIRWLQYPPG